MVNTWWVNQTDKDFADIWARERASDGRRVSARERVREAQPKDLVLHNHGRHLVAISQVVAAAFDEARDGTNGYKLPIDCAALSQPFFLGDLKPGTFPTGEGTPFKPGTNLAYQGYFFPVQEELAQILFRCLGMDAVDLHAATPTGVTMTLAGRTDADVISTVRREQPLLRRRLLAGRTEAPCALCGRTVPSEYLIASHIKRRSDCTEEERRDTNVAMLACLLGCDAAFERGDVYVDQGGRLRIREQAPQIIRQTFAAYDNRSVAVHSSATGPYFEHRRTSQG